MYSKWYSDIERSRLAKGEREDSKRPLIQEMVRALPAEVIHYEIIPDEKEKIAEALKKSADKFKADLIPQRRNRR